MRYGMKIWGLKKLNHDYWYRLHHMWKCNNTPQSWKSNSVTTDLPIQQHTWTKSATTVPPCELSPPQTDDNSRRENITGARAVEVVLGEEQRPRSRSIGLHSGEHHRWTGSLGHTQGSSTRTHEDKRVLCRDKASAFQCSIFLVYKENMQCNS
jgi:hypothetical protein